MARLAFGLCWLNKCMQAQRSLKNRPRGTTTIAWHYTLLLFVKHKLGGSCLVLSSVLLLHSSRSGKIMKVRSGRILSGSNSGARTTTAAITSSRTATFVAPSSTRRSAKRHKRDDDEPSSSSVPEQETRDFDWIRATFVADYKFAPHEDPHVQRLQRVAQTLSLPGDGAAIRRVLYPGSWIHISPSIVFPNVTYVDSFTGRKNLLKTFFHDHHRLLLSYLEAHKRYPEDPSVTLRQQDYRCPVPNVEPGSMDLLISLDAGAEISTTCAQYVRKGGYLYVNDGHGDACRAFASPSVWKLCGALEQQQQSPEDMAKEEPQKKEDNDGAEHEFRLLTSAPDLERYFVHQKKREKDRLMVETGDRDRNSR